MYEFYIDGGYSNGDGAYAVVVYHNNIKLFTFGDYIPNTTNNQMELSAFIAAVSIIGLLGYLGTFTIISDSEYVVKGVKEYLANWKANNWKGSTGKEIKNIKYWRFINGLLIGKTNINIEHVKGHSGVVGNEYADKACSHIKSIKNLYITSYLSDISFYQLKTISSYIKETKVSQDKEETKLVSDTPKENNINQLFKLVKMPEALQERNGDWIIFEGFPAKIIPVNN